MTTNPSEPAPPRARPTLDRVACIAARGTGVLFGAFAAFHLAHAATGGAPSLLFGVLMAGFSLGLLLLHPAALKLTPAVLLLAALIIPVGLLSPFRGLEAAPRPVDVPGFMAKQIALALATAAILIALAWLCARARTVVARRGRGAD